ncbi:hypothetical protein F7725_006752 [Dissostichus mawsoni]|uniref:Uncharacterized protein n=1 Tax=Dissostichus mawsoni TaxID=36200 RepID=A0A7J5XUT5_DISMA|nr:hypothetical protein F7725_006752 [Dissostichus mawsoni]
MSPAKQVTEEFDSVVSMAERLNEQVELMMEEEEKQKQSQKLILHHFKKTLRK